MAKSRGGGAGPLLLVNVFPSYAEPVQQVTQAGALLVLKLIPPVLRSPCREKCTPELLTPATLGCAQNTHVRWLSAIAAEMSKVRQTYADRAEAVDFVPACTIPVLLVAHACSTASIRAYT